jgi:hypothetical protein
MFSAASGCMTSARIQIVSSEELLAHAPDLESSDKIKVRTLGSSEAVIRRDDTLAVFGEPGRQFVAVELLANCQPSTVSSTAREGECLLDRPDLRDNLWEPTRRVRDIDWGDTVRLTAALSFTVPATLCLVNSDCDGGLRTASWVSLSTVAIVAVGGFLYTWLAAGGGQQP